jgi:hypothetical protein
MNNKYAIIILIAVALTLCGFTLGREGQKQVGNSRIVEVPEFVPYMFLFDHHYFNLKKAAELEQQGKDGHRLHSIFQRQAGLTDQQASTFDQITFDCEQALAMQDAKAQAVIAAFRLRYPVGNLPAGVTLPPPPPELTTMQQERNAIILRARDRLRTEWGEQDFTRFDAFLKSHIVSAGQPGH